MSVDDFAVVHPRLSAFIRGRSNVKIPQRLPINALGVSVNRLRRWRTAGSACVLLLGLPLLVFGQRYSFKHYARAQGLGNLSTLCLLQDSIGYLWIGTQHGLFRYDGARFLSFDIGNG